MKKIFRKACTLVLGCTIAMTIFSGCGGNSANQATTAGKGTETAVNNVSASTQAVTAAQSNEPVSLKVLSFATDRVDMFKQLNTEYRKIHPNVEIIYDAKDMAQYFTILATLVQSGEAPDLFATLGVSSSNLGELVDQGICLPMDGLVDFSGYPDWLVKIYTINGKIYAIPGLVEDSLGIFYNKKIFDKYGLSKPKTQQDVDTICQTLIKNNVTPFAIAGKDATQCFFAFDIFEPAYAADWNTNWPFNGRKFDDPEFLNAVKLFASWIDKGYFGKDYLSLDNNSVMMQLMQGKVAMTMQGAWESANYKDSTDIHVFQLKRPDGQDAGITSPKQDTALSVYAKSRNKDAAVDFAKYFATAPVQQLIANLGGSVPSSFPMAKGITAPSTLLTEFAQKDHSEMAFADMGGFIPLQGVDYFGGMSSLFQKLVFKKVTPDQLVEEANKLVDYSKIKK